MRYQPIYDIAELCARKNIHDAVLCPGSRCAPLTLAFARHPDIDTKTFSDERSAGFVALGMAQARREPVVVVCTSGTAVYNLAPAVAEAFFSETPLIVLTADRPEEWIAQHDGQTIYQRDVFGKHVKGSYQLPQDYDHPDSLWAINRIVNDALNLSRQAPAGPVHINAPFREPLYPVNAAQAISYSPDLRVIEDHPQERVLTEATMERIREGWISFNNVLVVGAQHSDDVETRAAVQALQSRHRIPVVHDIISNLHGVVETVQHADLFLGQASERLKEMLRPDLLITFGNSLISKNLKIFLRKFPASRHWHIQPAGPVADTFKTVTDVFRVSPAAFLSFLSTLESRDDFDGRKQRNYCDLWSVEERRVRRVLDDFFKEEELNELNVVKGVLERLPDNCALHLSNSMSVRYANFIGLHGANNGIEVFSNRGTSGIDGSNSTAVGYALASGRPTFLITGDLAFFYDRNAFWHNYRLPNLRIVLLNNHGGLIFDVLEGPSSMPEAAEYFITRQQLNATKLSEEFGFELLRADHQRKMKNLFKDLFTFDGATKIMEVETTTAGNKMTLETLKTKIKNSYDA